jgi:hypothetical protein
VTFLKIRRERDRNTDREGNREKEWVLKRDKESERNKQISTFSFNLVLIKSEPNVRLDNVRPVTGEKNKQYSNFFIS